ncbi:MAG: energy transducer TonB [Alteraurantiacibacter sp.]
MLVFLAASGLMLIGCAASQADLSRGVAPIDQGEWARQIAQSYPARALRRSEEGNVSLTVAVDNFGRVKACSVTASSGYLTLDEAACIGVTRYARFDPALGRDGDPVEDEWSTTVAYRIPR